MHKGALTTQAFRLPVIPSFSKSVRGEKSGDDAGDRRTSRGAGNEHLPLRDIADAITPALLHEVMLFCITICAPNLVLPNRAFWLRAESARGRRRSYGYGRDRHIIPVLDELREQGMKLNGPLLPIPCFSRNISITPTPCWRCPRSGSSRAKIPGLRARCEH